MTQPRDPLARRSSRSQRRILRCERQARVARLFLSGTRTTRLLARICGVSTQTINRDLQYLQRVWEREAAQIISEEKYLALIRLQRLEAEALEAWEKSKVDEVQVEVRRADDGESGNSVEMITKKRTRYGDARLLSTLLDIGRERRVLLGIAEARSTSPSGHTCVLVAGIDTAYHALTDDELRDLVEQQRRLDAAAQQARRQ